MARLMCATLAVAAALLATAAQAQYPNRPVKIIAPFPPGGAIDLTARVFAQPLSDRLGQPVLVENRPGGNGVIAGEIVAKAAADGYTLLLGFDTLFAVNPHVYGKMSYDPLKALIPIGSLTTNQLFLSVTPGLPPKTFAEFVEYARRANPPLYYASVGNGSTHHFAMESLKQRAAIVLVHVPFKGGALAATSTMAGEVSTMFAGVSTMPQIRAGQLRPLAVSGPKRSPLLPELPTVGEFYPGYEVTNWTGLFAPAGTPEPALARLRHELSKVLTLPEVKQRLMASGPEPNAMALEDFIKLIHSDHEKYGQLVKAVGVKLD